MINGSEGLKETELAAGALGVRLQQLDIRSPTDIEPAFREASKGHANALLVLGSPVLASQRTQFADLAVKSGLPAIYSRSEFVEDGGLMSYAVELYRLGPARRYVCGQDPEGQKARRPARGAAEEVRAGDQFENREADRHDHSAVCALPGGQGDQIIEENKTEMLGLNCILRRFNT